MDLNTLLLVGAGGLLAWNLSRVLLGKVAPAKARELVERGALLLDVRTPGEFAGGHIAGARNVPLQELGARVGELGDRDRPVVLYCASGMRSASAASALKRAGFKHVFDLGAMGRWPAAG